ncbi:MAG: CehA/McbA family metallohydrolase [Lentisphaeria bacterium]|nr:CehA/McbA family metallohydrolase [Lentisphaeria bacterium]
MQTSLINPFGLHDADGYMWLKGNLHTHTTNSDGRVAPQARLDQYAAKGYDFLCLSDHDMITRVDTVCAPDNFVLVQGAELHPLNPFGGRQYHLLCLDIHEDMDSEAMAPQEVIDSVNDQGGAVWLAHPHFCAINILRDVMPLTGFAGIEVFNTSTRLAGRGEASVQWDDWSDLGGHLVPTIANDDAHATEAENRDTYAAWTVVRAKERSVAAIMQAIKSGASYATTGPDFHDISLSWIQDGTEAPGKFKATIRSSEALRVLAVTDYIGAEYTEQGKMFDRCELELRADNKWVRFELIGPNDTKAWSNPFDLALVQAT